MKKILSFLGIFMISILMVSCKKKPPKPTNTKPTETHVETTVDEPTETHVETTVDEPLENIVFSKLFTARRRANNLIEIYNNTDKDIDLTNYAIDFYGDGETEVTSSIELAGVIKSKDYYVLASDNFEFEEYESKFDYIHDGSLPFNGDDAMAISYKGRVIDFIGYNTGIAIRYSVDSTMIRLGLTKDYQANAKFDGFNFIKYLPDKYEYLKNDDHKIKTFEQIMMGPSLYDFYLDLEYSSNGIGTGGAPIATLSHVADGDTATFNFAGKPNTSSHRYYYIDTPEKGGANTNDEPWGEVATFFNRNVILANASQKEIRVQSVPQGALTETYGRNLGLIWVNDQLSQFLIVREGLSKVNETYDDIDLLLHWNDVPFKTFLLFAQNNAKVNGWGVHGYPFNSMGEMAPDWDYRDDTRIYDFDWGPHYPVN